MSPIEIAHAAVRRVWDNAVDDDGFLSPRTTALAVLTDLDAAGYVLVTRAELAAIEQHTQRAKADAEHQAYLRRCAETECQRVQRELDRRNT